MRSGVVAGVHLCVATLRRCGATAASASALVFVMLGSVRAYRGQADLPELMARSEVRFRQQQAIPLEIHASLLEGLGVGVGDATQDAAWSWEAVACIDIGFRIITASSQAVAGDGRNTLALVAQRWSEYDASTATIAITDIVYAQRPDGGLDIVEADILFNDEHFDFALDASAAGLDFRTVLRHELGHLLGLAHCCELGVEGEINCAAREECAGSLMHPLYDANASVALSSDDVRGICHVYTPGPCEAGCAEGEECIAGRCWSATGTSCVRDGDCQDGDRCLDDRCIPEAPALGDPCVRDIECGSGSCATEGLCTVSCSGLCAPGYRCDSRQLCVPSAGAFGDPCSRGEVCTTGICLLSSEGACTRECSHAHPCPLGFDCSEVGGTYVCASSGGGCAVSRATKNSDITSILASLAALIFARRRRWHRGRHHEGI